MDLPAFYNSLDGSLEEACALITKGASDRRSAAHTSVVANIDLDGNPQQRVMILRHFEPETRLLRFHTDSRSTKVGQLDATQTVSLLFYDPDAKVQLRLQGRASIEYDTARADTAWNESTEFARRCYLAEAAPGAVSEVPLSGLPAAMEGVKPTIEDIAPARPNFAVMLVEFDSVEWLYLANAGHRRAKWCWDGARKSWHGEWLVP